MALEVCDVAYSYGDRVALDGVDVEVTPGVLTGLLGPNGAGKTTLMRIVLGVLTPDRGEVRLHGAEVDSAARLRWGYMPQERGLYPGMPVGDQVVYFGRLHGLSRAEATRRTRDLLDELGLSDRWDQRTDKLSGGLQQRLQLATALVHEPDVIVLDEPFAGLDPVAVAELSQSLRERARAGCTVLFSSHQLDLVQNLCEDIVLVDEGRVVLRGPLASLRAASTGVQLRVNVRTRDRSWLDRFAGATIVSEEADEVRIAIPHGTDPLDVLDAARAAGRVEDFGLDLPSLSQLFLEAVTPEATTGSTGPAGASRPRVPAGASDGSAR